MRPAGRLAGLLLASIVAAGPVAAQSPPAASPQSAAAPVARLQGLDKTTARISQFDAPVGVAVPFGTLSIVVRDCQHSSPEEAPENAAFLEIFENRPGEQRVRRFSGWMFSSSPAISALEHAVYDVYLLECKLPSAPPPVAPATAAPPAAPSPPGSTRGKTAR